MILIQVNILHSLPSGISVGRSNIKQVADKRRADIEKFLVSLFKMAPEISQSDLVYTFFHPLLRDQQNADIHLRKVKGTKNFPKYNNIQYLNANILIVFYFFLISW